MLEAKKSATRGRMAALARTLARYGVAPVLVLLAFQLHEVLSPQPHSLPTYITFYPSVMVVAVLCGFYPGLLATLLSAIFAAYWLVPPYGEWKIERRSDVIGLVIFSAMGLLMSSVASLYRHARRRTAALEMDLAVAETKDRLRFALRAARAGAWEWDLRTNASVWSDEVWGLYGIEPNSCVPSFKAWCQAVAPEDRARFEETVREAARRGADLSVEWRIRDRNGVERWLMSQGQPRADAGGAPQKYLGIVIDITERKRAEEALREREERLAVTLRSIGDAVIATDEAGRITVFNKVAEALTGWPAAEAAGRPIQEIFNIVNEETRRPAESPVDRVLREGIVVGLANHTALVARDGTERPIADSGAPIRDSEGRISGVVLVFRDQSEERKAEAALARLATIVESSDAAIISTDLRGTILTWNQAAESLLGYRASEAVGQPIELILPPERRQEETEFLSRIRAGERVAHLETQRVKKDGHAFDVSVTISPLLDREGRITGASKIMRDITAQKRAEAALRLSEERFAKAFAQNAAAMVITRADDGSYLEVNETWLSMFGYRREEVLGKTGLELNLWPRPRDREQLFEQIRATGSFRDVEVNCRRRSGETVVVLSSGETVTWGGQTVVIGSLLDITDRKRAEEALRESEGRFRKMANAIPQLAWMARSDGYIHWYNDRWYQYTGATPEQMEGWGWQRVHDPEALPRVLDGWRASIATGQPFDMVFPLRGADGRFRSFLTRVVPLKDAHGNVVQWFGTNTDVTERVEAEKALQRTRLGLSQLAEASRRVVREIDLTAMLQAISGAALALTGARIATCGHGDVNGSALVGGQARVPGAPACPPGNMFLFERGGVHVELLEGKDSLRLSDKELRSHPRWWGAPEGHVPLRGLLGVKMIGRNGRPSGLILATDKMGGEFTEEDESLLRQLATIASLALQHVEARVALEASDKSKNEFLAMLSHELRNPLAPIRNSLYLLDRATPGGEQALRAREIIERQVMHLTRLVDDLLDMTRISRGKIQVRKDRVDIGEVVARTADDQRSSFVELGINLEVLLPGKPLWIDGDWTRLAQAIGNILHNASKFTPAGGQVTVTVEAFEGVGQALVRVRDTGIGIGPEMLPRVFEPFAQADTSLDRSRGGLGLGLALVKALVEMHGGTATVSSEGLGKGAEFVLRLPLDGVQALEAAPPPIGAPRARRILVIEDNVDAANSLGDVLELLGHIVKVALTGPKGIEIARSFNPDIVLCDIGLPGMDGHEVARALRAEPPHRRVRLIALTGYASPDDVAKAGRSGFDAHLAKPVKVETLQDMLAREEPRDER